MSSPAPVRDDQCHDFAASSPATPSSPAAPKRARLSFHDAQHNHALPSATGICRAHSGESVVPPRITENDSACHLQRLCATTNATTSQRVRRRHPRHQQPQSEPGCRSTTLSTTTLSRARPGSARLTQASLPALPYRSVDPPYFPSRTTPHNTSNVPAARRAPICSFSSTFASTVSRTKLDADAGTAKLSGAIARAP